MHRKVGDYVSVAINHPGDGEHGRGNILILGIVGAIDERKGTAQVVECWAYHEHSGNDTFAGEVITAPVNELRAPTERQRGIIEQAHLGEYSRVQNTLDELLAPAHP